MASKFKKKGGIKDTKDSGFGTYSEENGGGSPKGGVWGGTNGRVGWDERINRGEVGQNEHRVDQPRDAGGRFTYNSVNGKETKYESRGKTVNPLLLGDMGKETVYIDDVKDSQGNVLREGVRGQFERKSGEYYDKFKDSWYQAGSEKITKEGRKLKTVKSKNDIWEIARVSFDIQAGAFTFESDNFETKKGRRSAAENAARSAARASNEETYVADPTSGGIKRVAGAQPGQRLSTGISFDLADAIRKRKGTLLRQGVFGTPSTGVGITPSGQIQPMKPGSSAQPVTLAHSPQQIKALRNILTKQGIDVSKFTDQQLSGILDKRNKK